jgi:hypothetical protein
MTILTNHSLTMMLTVDHGEYAAPRQENILMKMVKHKKWRKALSFLTTRYGHEIAAEQDEFGNTLLHVALGYSAPEDFLLKLIEIYSDATRVEGVDDWLPLHMAAMWGCSAPVMNALIRNYPQALDLKGESGRTPRQFSTRFEHNKEALERTTSEWVAMTRVKRQKS